jgi:hypothetical protein
MSHKVSTFLHEERGFRYAIANETFGDAIIDLLSDCFSREPMGAALGLSAHALAPLIARFIPECTNNSLSVIATPADHSESWPAHSSAGTSSHRCPSVFREIFPGSVRSRRR